MINMELYYQITITVLLIVGLFMSLTMRRYYKQYETALHIIVAIDKERQNLQKKYEGKATLMEFNKLNFNDTGDASQRLLFCLNFKRDKLGNLVCNLNDYKTRLKPKGENMTVKIIYLNGAFEFMKDVKSITTQEGLFIVTLRNEYVRKIDKRLKLEVSFY